MSSGTAGKPHAPTQLSLVELLHPDGGENQSLESALKAFNSHTDNGDDDDDKASDQDSKVDRRNSIAGILMAVSERNCDIYVENLRGSQAGWRTTLGAMGVMLGSAGSMVTDSPSARSLSALSGATGGLSGKLDEGVLAGRGAEVILTGIRAAREPIRLAIINNIKTATTYSEWPVEVAIADVARYHGRCNVVSGLSAVQSAVDKDIANAKPETPAPDSGDS